MKIILVITFFLYQVGWAASSPPTLKDEGRIIISQEELESFLRLLVIKKMELEKIESTIIDEQSIQKSFETPLAPIAEKTQKTQVEPTLQKQTVSELQKETLREQATDLKPSPTKPKITTEPTQVEETLEKLQNSIEILKERLRTIESDQKETKIEIFQEESKKTVSGNTVKGKVEKLPEPSSLEQRLKAQSDEISNLRFMVESLLSRPVAPLERQTSTITHQQPVYIVSSQQSPSSRQLFDNKSQETNDERLRELIESMNLAIEIDQTPATLLRDANDTEEILNVQSLDIPKLREPDVELQLMIENFFLKMEVEQLANEMDSLRKEFLQLKTTVGEIKKSNIEEQKQAPLLARDREFTVFFANNSSSLSASDSEMVKTIAKKVVTNATLNVILNGYSSITGSAEYNMLLSKRRADEVSKALIANGLLPDRISIFYHGADPKTPEENARRVEILIAPIVETKVIEP